MNISDIPIYEQCKELEQENAELKAENERLKEENFNFEEIVKLCRCEQYQQTLQEIKEYINAQGIDNKWNMRIQRFRSEILQKITKAEEE